MRFSPNSIALLAKYVTVVECRPIMSVNIVSQFQPSTFGHNLPTLHGDLSAIAELLATALHGMQTRSGDENFVRLSNAWIVSKQKKDLSRFLYLTKYYHLT